MIKQLIKELEEHRASYIHNPVFYERNPAYDTAILYALSRAFKLQEKVRCINCIECDLDITGVSVNCDYLAHVVDGNFYCKFWEEKE